MNIFDKFGLSSSATRAEAERCYLNQKSILQEQSFAIGSIGEDAAEKLQQLEVDYVELCRAIDDNEATAKYGDIYGKIEDCIKQGELKQAQASLDAISQRTAEWHYLQSIIYYKHNWFLESKKQLEFAMSLEPTNAKYSDSYTKLTKILAGNTINPDQLRTTSRPTGGGFQRANNGTCTGSCCGDLCLANCCADCLCHSGCM